MALGALTGLWLALAAATPGYEAQLRAHTRVRSTTALEAPGGAVANDWELQPRLTLRLGEGNRDGWLTYAPRLTLRQTLGAPRPELLHTGRLRGEWRVRRGLRLSLEEYATYGTVDLLTQRLGLPGPGEPQAPDEVPLEPVPPGAVGFASSLTTLGWETTALHPRLRLWGTLGYTVAGGLDDAARQVLPLRWGPRLQADARYALAPLDALTTTLTATDLRFSSSQRATVVQLDEVWAHRFSRATDLELGAGVGFTRSHQPDTGELRRDVLPGARAAVRHRWVSRAHPVEARLTGRVAPFVDRLTGAVYPRLESTLLVTWTAAPGLWVYGQGGAGRALGGGTQREASVLLGVLGARWGLARGVSLEGDLRTHHQRQPGGQRAERSDWAATVGLSVSHAGMF